MWLEKIEIGPDTVAERGRAFVPETPDRRRLFDLEGDPGEHHDLRAIADDRRQGAVRFARYSRR